MKNTFENNSAKAARQPMLESAADSQQFASAECAATDTTMYQVNIYTDMDDEMSYDIITYAEDGYKGVTRGTTSSDGSYEQTEWCAFVGTFEECQSFVADRDKWCVIPTVYQYGRKGTYVLKVTPQRLLDAIFVGSEKECKAEAERYIAENMRPMDYISDVKNRAFKSEDEAMKAINEMVKHLNSRGDEILIKPFVDKDLESGLVGLGVEITEVWKASDESEEDQEYTNWFSIGIEGSNWNTKDAVIIRGIQAAAYLTWVSVKDMFLKKDITLLLTEDNKVWNTYEEYSIVQANPMRFNLSGKLERDKYCIYFTYSEVEELYYKDLMYIVDALENHRLLKPIVLK